ncbi:MAG: peptidoglycan DD-metalloendopeptidase family protein [Gammaproteobacteria bacterium]|nr:peptidoglycan DD-metalloendopeptidase family protein [Gammaproteobacteria bacterium]
MAVRFLDLESVASVLPDGEPVSAPVSMPLTLPEAASPPAATIAHAPVAALSQSPTPEPVAMVTEPQTEVIADSLLADPMQTEPATEAAQEPHSTQQVAGEPEDDPALDPEPVAQRWIEHEVAKGESLARIFAGQELDAALLHRIVNSSESGKKLAQIRPGQKFRFLFDDEHELVKMELHRNRVHSLQVEIADDDITIEEISKDVDKRVAGAAGVIESSLFVDAQNAGLSDGKIMELAEIFGWDIDFALEIRAGDAFRVLYEEHYLDGEKLRDGPILAAEFTNRGTTYRAVRFEDSNGDVGYFDADGHSKRRAFIRTPIKFARVSSGFNPRRWHPVLKKWRSHKGVDYAAPIGTPVRATGNGRIVFRGTKSGYGKTVIIEHASKYTTLYAHLNGYSKRSATGKRVKQGQVIGYVGKTGLATGPHLHYEFRIGGQHRDPLKVKLPKSLALAKSDLGNFRKTAAPLLARLDAIPAATMVASAESTLSR